MAKFRYLAKNMAGKTARGTLEAAGETALQQQLREQGLFLIEAKNLTEDKGYKKPSSKELSEFCKELSSLLASGVSIVRALDIIASSEGISHHARELYADVLADLKRGISFSEAMESKGCFPELMLGMIRSGEGSGNIDQVAERLHGHYEKEFKLNQQVRSAMMYPMLLLVMCAGVVILIVTFILPQFETLFAEMESLPAPTKVLMAISDFLVSKWYLAALFVFAAVALIRLLLGIPGVRRFVDYSKVRLPVIGRLNKTIYTARFSRTLSSLYSSGMPIAGAIATAGDTIGNVYVEEQFAQVTLKVRGGVALSEALRDVDGLLRKLASTILVGEESGRLDIMLDSIAGHMEAEAEQATKRLMTILEPLLICIMALIVGFIVVAVMMPILSSYAAIESAA